MSLRSRIRAFLSDAPEVPNTADTEEEAQEIVMPWHQCRWVQVDVHCRIPLNDSENWPNGCDAVCPARLQNEQRAHEREQESQRLYF